MKNISTKNEINAVIHPHCCLIKLGLDLSLKSIVVVCQQDGHPPQPAQSFSQAKFLAWLEKRLKTGAKIYSVYEAGPFGFGLHRQLTALGVTNYVVCPQNLDERGTGIKTDGRDALALCLRLDRYVAGNPHALAVVRVPTENEEQRRSVNRQRDQLVKTRKQLEAQGKSLLLQHGFPAPSTWWRPTPWKRLHTAWPHWLVARLEVWQRLLQSLHAEILSLTQHLQQQVPHPLPKGIGTMTMATLTNEIGDWNRFQNRRQIASFCGLCPRQYSSGAKVQLGAITKRGNPRLRHQCIELAWRIYQFQPHYLPRQRCNYAPTPTKTK